jgi:hypothetical protein
VESFSLSEAIGVESGYHTVVKWHDEGVFHEPEVVALRRKMIEAAAELVRRMHFAGLAHQDLFGVVGIVQDIEITEIGAAEHGG